MSYVSDILSKIEDPALELSPTSKYGILVDGGTILYSISSTLVVLVGCTLGYIIGCKLGSIFVFSFAFGLDCTLV